MMRNAISLLLAALLFCACSAVEPIPARTQVTLRISSTDQELREQLTQLRVTVRLNEHGSWKAPVTKTFPTAQLKWPVEIPVTPRTTTEHTSQFEVVVDVLRESEAIAQARLIAGFIANEQRVQDVELFLCRSDQGTAVCAEPECVGAECLVCDKAGACVPVSMLNVTEEPTVIDIDGGGVEQEAAAATSGSLDSAAASQGNPEAGASEAGAAEASVVSEYALGLAGMPCGGALEQSLACEGHASRKILKCQQGTWQVLQTCGPSERCDSRVGTLQGTCAIIPAACVGKSPGEICDGAARLECDIDLVNVTSKRCPDHTHCDVSAASKCACDAGYEPDGQGVCQNPNNCPANACSGGRCLDGLSDWSCDCNEGFAGTGTKTCTPVMYCPKDACAPGGTCVDTMNWSCQCGSGYTGTGTRACVNQNDCPVGRCVAPNGTCQDLVGTYKCNCNPGFSGGADCVNDICAPNPCRNGGACSRTGTLCACQPGFSGANCQTDVCNPSPCRNGGSCSRTGSRCACPAGYSGASCEIDACNPNPCLNGGTCSRSATGATCNCVGYTGSRCETRVDPCSGTTNACGGSCMTQLAHQPGADCNNGLLGACARNGKYVCQGTAATVCNAPSVAAGREICGDGLDNDCDARIDEEDAIDARSWYRDCDNDGYAALASIPSCAKPGATATCQNWLELQPTTSTLDCDDSSGSYNPGYQGYNYSVTPNLSFDHNCSGNIEFQSFVSWPMPAGSILSNVAYPCPAGLGCADCWRAACEGDTSFFGCSAAQFIGERRCSRTERDLLVRIATPGCSTFTEVAVSQACH